MPKTKQQKREEAAERQAAYDSLTPEQKWDRLFHVPGGAKRQRRRLSGFAVPNPNPAVEAKSSVPKGAKRMPDGTPRPKQI